MDDARELLYGLPVREISAHCRVSIDTARRWKRRGRMPPGMLRLLELVTLGELGAIARAWHGWRLIAGELVSPEAWRFAPGEIRSIPFRHGQIHQLERQVRELVRRFDADPDRRRRLEAFADLARSLLEAQRALEQLRDQLTDRELDELHERTRRPDLVSR